MVRIRNKSDDVRRLFDVDSGGYIYLKPGEEIEVKSMPKFAEDYFEIVEEKKSRTVKKEKEVS